MFDSEFLIASVVCACVIGGALLGLGLRAVLPEHHIGEPSRQIVNVAIGLIATLSALVLGLLVASAKSSFDARNDEVKTSAAKLILLDRTLRQYGPETAPLREVVRKLTQRRIDHAWGNADAGGILTTPADVTSAEQVRTRLFALAPANDAQRWQLARALAITAEIEQARWLAIEENRSSIPRPFLVVLVSWLTAIFASLGLFAPRNATVYAVLFVCALSVSTAIFLILEMDQPYEGLLRISSAPLVNAVAEMGR
ncbi:MAG: hypothetical protein U1F48_13590 [Burkholderiales bacterium]